MSRPNDSADNSSDGFDSRSDSQDSRGDSWDATPPPRRPGLGLAGLIVATVAVLVELAGVAFVIEYKSTWKARGGSGGSGVDCLAFLVLMASVLALVLCVLAMSMTGAGLGISGIVRGRGRGRRLGIYAVCLSVVSLVALVALVISFLTN